MLKEVLIAILVFGTIIPVWPAILYHVGKGIWDDFKKWKRRCGV